MAFKLAELFSTITARDVGFSAALGKMRASLKKFSTSMDGAVRTAKRSLLAIGAATTGVVAAFASFEQKMANVKSVMRGITDGEFKDLTEKAREMGRTTAFSAGQAAEAMEEFAKSGFSVNEILAAIGPTLDLAAAATIGMGEAASVAAGVLRGMSLDVSELTRVMDVLVGAAVSSSNTVPLLGEAMRNVGSAASAAGQSLEEILAVLSILGNKMIQGAQAGTGLKALLTRLQAQPADVVKAMKLLGVEAFDKTSGKMRSFGAILNDIIAGMKKLTPQQQAAAAAAIAGVRQVGLLLALIKEGPGAIDRFKNKLKEMGGVAKDVASARLKTLIGGLKIMFSAVSDVAIALGKLLGPAFKKIIKEITSAINWFGKLSDKTIDTIVQIVALGAAISTAIIAVQGIVIGMTLLLNPLGLVLGVVVAIGGAFAVASLEGTTFTEKMINAIDSLKSNIEGTKSSLTNIAKSFLGVTAVVITAAQNMRDVLGIVFGQLGLSVFGAILDIVSWLRWMVDVMFWANRRMTNLMIDLTRMFEATLRNLGKFLQDFDLNEIIADALLGKVDPKSFTFDPLEGFIETTKTEFPKKFKRALTEFEKLAASGIEEKGASLGKKIKKTFEVLLDFFGLGDPKSHRVLNFFKSIGDAIIDEINRIVGIAKNVIDAFDAGGGGSPDEEIKKKKFDIEFTGIDEAFKKLQRAVGKDPKKDAATELTAKEGVTQQKDTNFWLKRGVAIWEKILEKGGGVSIAQ